MRTRRIVALVIALGLGAVGCGVGANDSPQVLATDDVPFALLDPELSSTTTQAPSSETRPFPMYLVRRTDEATELVAVEREVSVNPQASEILSTLLETEPSRSEEIDGLSTSIPPDTRLLTAPERNDVQKVLTINLSPNIQEITGERLRDAFAQLVFTATEMFDVERVRFEVDGEPVAVTIGDSSETDDPVSRNDYRSLDPDR